MASDILDKSANVSNTNTLIPSSRNTFAISTYSSTTVCLSKRLSLGLTLLEVADLVGVKEATMQRYESGEIKNIKHETIVKLSNIFNCTPQYLMGWANEDESSGDIDKIHIEKYNMLNDDGKAKLNERLDELLELPKYRK